MGRDGDAALGVDEVDGVRRGQARPDPVGEKKAEDVPLPAGDLFADHHPEGRGAGGVFGSAQRTLDGVVVGDGDNVERGLRGGVVDHVPGRRPAVAVCGVDVEVGQAAAGHWAVESNTKSGDSGRAHRKIGGFARIRRRCQQWTV